MSDSASAIYRYNERGEAEKVGDLMSPQLPAKVNELEGRVDALESSGGPGGPSPDNVTVAASDGKLVVKDIAIGGDAGDLASARGIFAVSGKSLDCNDLTKSGMYRCYATGSVNTPAVGSASSGIAGKILVIADSAGDYVTQVFYSDLTGSPKVWTRNYDSSIGWRPWRLLLSEYEIGDGIHKGPNGVFSVPEYDGATSSEPGTAGLVPPATSAERERFFRGDGTYVEVLSRKYDARVGDLHFYVRADGNDANDGLADSPERAFKTTAKVMRAVVSETAPGAGRVTVHYGEGEFVGGLSILNLPFNTALTITGAGKDKTKSLVSSSASAIGVLLGSGGATTTINNLCIEFVRTTQVGGFVCDCIAGTTVFNSVRFSIVDRSDAVEGDYGYYIVAAVGQAVANIRSGCEFVSDIQGSPTVKPYVIGALNGGVVTVDGDITCSGSAGVFASAYNRGYMRMSNAVFSGSMTGRRYYASSGSIIYTNGQGPDFLPGSTAGSVQTASGALYY